MNSRLKTLEDFHEALDRLIDRLYAENFKDDATRLDELFHHTAWTTGSELLGELQVVLKAMGGKYSDELARAIDDCHAFTVHHRKILGLR